MSINLLGTGHRRREGDENRYDKSIFADGRHPVDFAQALVSPVSCLRFFEGTIFPFSNIEGFRRFHVLYRDLVPNEFSPHKIFQSRTLNTLAVSSY